MSPFLAERERLGAICRPFSFQSSAGSYFLVHPPLARRNRALAVFKRWLMSEIADLQDAR